MSVESRFPCQPAGSQEINGEHHYQGSHRNCWSNCFVRQMTKTLLRKHDERMHEQVDECRRNDDSLPKCRRIWCEPTSIVTDQKAIPTYEESVTRGFCAICLVAEDDRHEHT